jgi:hypothetical protein
MNPDERRQAARESRDLLNDPAFQRSVFGLRKQWFGELLIANTDGHKLELVAKLKVLEEMAANLQSYITSEAMAQKGKQNG